MLYDLLLSALANAVPLVVAAVGEVFVERAGLVNLGLEGLMALGAVVGVLAGSALSSPHAGLAAGALAGALLSLAYLLPVVCLRANMIVVGLCISFLGVGVSEALGLLTQGAPSPPLTRTWGPLTAEGAAMLILFPAAAYIVLYKTWVGRGLRAIGEGAELAAVLGIPVARYRAAAVLVGGLLAGLAGAYIPLGLHYGRWYSGVTAGWGWVALGVVVLGQWHPLGTAASGMLVGLLFALRPLLPTWGLHPSLADAAPYVLVLLAVVLSARVYKRLGIRPPASLWRAE